MLERGSSAQALPEQLAAAPQQQQQRERQRDPSRDRQRRDNRSREMHTAGAASDSFVRSKEWPDLPVLCIQPPTRGYGEKAVAYAIEIGAYPWPALRNYNVRGGDKRDFELGDRDRERLIKNIDQLVSHNAPVAFIDLEDHVKYFNKPDSDERTLQRLVEYNTAVVDLITARRPETRWGVWNHPNRRQMFTRYTEAQWEEWRRRQWMWEPMIKKAGLISANCYIWWNDVERDLAWMVPYLELCLEMAGDDVPVYVTVAAGQQGKMNPVPKERLVTIWRRLAEVEVDGRRITGFDLYMPYKAKHPQWTRRGDPVQKKQYMSPELATEQDELLKWSMDTLMRIVTERDKTKEQGQRKKESTDPQSLDPSAP
jgi:hypothetical protein